MRDEQPELVRDLLRPTAYPDGVERVTLRVTHASWVFLTEAEVFKVKRPVDFGFLDYHTVEARRNACHEEVRVNARLAPDVYLGVLPVRRTRDGLMDRYSIAADGPADSIVDWAVHMRRLPDAASAAALLSRGDLDAAALESVAERLARFLDEARPAPSYGTPAALAGNLEENFTQTASLVGSLLARKTFDDVQAFQRAELQRHEARFLERIADDRIREGHGDVRLEHIYFPAGVTRRDPVIIDAIEFNQRFRCGDVAAEIAFPAMELEAAGRLDLADGLVARFAEASGDFALYGVLDFYLSYRAWVRGKVAAFVAADPSTSSQLRVSKEAEARRFFNLARAAVGPALDRPFLIAVGGLIGSGKSTLAGELGRWLAVPVISSDRTRKAEAGLAPTARGGAELYDPAAREHVYEEILRRADLVLASGRSVILDATFSARRWRERAAAAAERAGAAFVFVEAVCPPELLRPRLAARRHQLSVSDATETLLDTFMRDHEPFGSGELGPHVPVDTSGTVEGAARAAVRELAGLGIVPASERRRG
jgi:aminoglycoside phosphotransferase family enzyme/predicted kinase